MSVIADTPQVIQDLLAPEIASLKERLSALENKVDENEARAGTRHQELLTRIGSHKQELLTRMQSDDILRAIARIEDVNSIRDRLTRLEARKEVAEERGIYEPTVDARQQRVSRTVAPPG